MFKKPPDWKKVLSDPESMRKVVSSFEAMDLVRKANGEYLHWDRFRYQPMPQGISPEEVWGFLKLARNANREVLPINDENKNPFTVSITKEHSKYLSFIDSHSSGAIVTSDGMPDGTTTDRLIINGLIEEAISSSQIEGASTTRKVAKAMIELKRTPKNKDEQMILNNYKAMMQLEDWKNRDLNDSFILELHKILTEHTLEQSSDEGSFRNDEDEVVVVDNPSGDIIHRPPQIAEAKNMLKQLYNFANRDDDENTFIHPFVKASILHFCIGYIHPFVDGNGRLARALFYWYLIRKNYWMFKFLPISLQIKKQDWKPGYYRAFKYVETDEGDITYFLSYKLKLARNAIQDFIKYVHKKQVEANKLKEKLMTSDEINSRQLDVIELLQRNPNAEVDLNSYKERHKVVYQTARTDLLSLEDKRILKKIKRGKKYLFVRGEKFPTKKS
jgi:Fic family protein